MRRTALIKSNNPHLAGGEQARGALHPRLTLTTYQYYSYILLYIHKYHSSSMTNAYTCCVDVTWMETMEIEGAPDQGLCKTP